MAAAFFSASLSPAPLAASGGVEAGILACKSVPNTRVNLILHSRIDVTCSFETTVGKVEYYRGKTGIGLGLDINWDRQEEIGFTVINGGSDIRAGAHSLAGTYLGGKASVTLGVGAGAAALIGGSSDSIALHPLALEKSSGFGLSGGLGYLVLTPDTRGGAAGTTQPRSSAPQGEPQSLSPSTSQSKP
ncbi:MAG: DUF992 domain-containing protein [Alphaproteobacteria bacterium]|nr:DUF992 domain-containing protein [Alphaproteobacteria bacterium]